MLYKVLILSAIRAYTNTFDKYNLLACENDDQKNNTNIINTFMLCVYNLFNKTFKSKIGS